jgi:lysyl oxidase/Big-like domain-containing protein
MPRFSSARVLGVVIAALCCLLGAESGAAQGATEVLPDLVADAPARPQLQTYAHPDGTTHLLLRFDGFVHNRGPGAFEMRGSQRVGTDMTLTVQRVYRDDATFFDDPSRDPTIIWEPADGHNHWHLKNAARYSLWDSAKTAEVAPGMKVGFCLVDLQRIETTGPSTAQYTLSGNNFCGQNQPTATSVFAGVSAGWRDIYDRTLAFQWVDVTQVQPGTYWLRSEIDPDDFARETDEVNAPTFATSSSTIPGYRAKPVNAGVVSTTAPTTIPLATDSFGTGLGSRAFRIILSPQHGRLNVGGGSLFSTPNVTYTPNPGWVGPDNFSYEAHDSASSFPSFPSTAAVTLNVGGVAPNVAISGAPASMLAGTSARLLAAVFADYAFVNWTVDGVDSGTPQTGTVDAWGLYQAPAQAPPAGHVTIRATAAGSRAYDEVTIAITDPPPPQPAPATEAQLAALAAPTASGPSPGSSSSPVSGRRLRARLQGVTFAESEGALIVGLRSGRAGVIRVRVHKGKRLLGHCRVRTPRGRTLACKARLPSGMSPGGARAIVTLRAKGKLLEVVRPPRLGSHAHEHMHHHGH